MTESTIEIQNRTDDGAQYGAIFDMDGTLVASMAVWRKLEEDLCKMAGVDELPRSATDTMTAMTVPEIANFVVNTFGIGTPEEIAAEIKKKMFEFYTSEVEPKSGTLEYVRSLSEAGVKIAVASSTIRALLLPALTHAGFMPYLDVVHSAEEFESGKRDPEIYRVCAEEMGCAIENTWVFEDATYAVKCAKSGGFPTVGVHDDDLAGPIEELRVEADVAIGSFTELVAFPPRTK